MRILVKLGTRDCESMTLLLGSIAVGDGEDIVCLRDVCAVAGDDYVALTKNNARIAEGETGETRTEEVLKDGRHGVVFEFQFVDVAI